MKKKLFLLSLLCIPSLTITTNLADLKLDATLLKDIFHLKKMHTPALKNTVMQRPSTAADYRALLNRITSEDLMNFLQAHTETLQIIDKMITAVDQVSKKEAQFTAPDQDFKKQLIEQLDTKFTECEAQISNAISVLKEDESKTVFITKAQQFSSIEYEKALQYAADALNIVQKMNRSSDFASKSMELLENYCSLVFQYLNEARLEQEA